MTVKKSILLTTHHGAFLHRGGGEYELLEVALNLRKLGHVADPYGPYSRDVENYDAVIHFSIDQSGLSVVEEAKNAGKEIILWPNFWQEDTTEDTVRIGYQLLEMSDAVVFKSETERKFFERCIPLREKKVLMVPWGVDPAFTEETPNSLFRESFGLSDYTLWIGIIEPCKNQLKTIQALEDFQVPMVFIGNCRDDQYYRACREAAPKHFLFLKPIQHKSDLIRAAIRECSLYIEPSLDPPGKSILEAAFAGANILTCSSEWAREHFGSNAVYVDPEDPYSIQDGVARGLAMPKSSQLSRELIAKHAFPNVLQSLCEFLDRS